MCGIWVVVNVVNHNTHTHTRAIRFKSATCVMCFTGISMTLNRFAQIILMTEELLREGGLKVTVDEQHGLLRPKGEGGSSLRTT